MPDSSNERPQSNRLSRLAKLQNLKDAYEQLSARRGVVSRGETAAFHGDVIEALTMLHDDVSSGYANGSIADRLNLHAYFEEACFAGKTRWGVACAIEFDMTRIGTVWSRIEPEMRAGVIDRLLLISALPLTSQEQSYLQEIKGVHHLTITAVLSRVAEREGGYVDKPNVPAADGFVRIDHNRREILEAVESLHELAREAQRSNTLNLPNEERAALVEEILTLAGMLQQRVVRLAQVQFAVGHDSVLRYMKGRFKDHAIGALVAKALEALVKALTGF